VDSGSTHSFVSSEFLAKVGITPVPTTPKQVKLPNGDILISDFWVLTLLGCAMVILYIQI